MNKRPEKDEYAEFYAGYISLVEETNIILALQNQVAEIENLFAAMTDEKSDFRYAAGKWTIKESLGHIVDTERVFAYRALRISRGDKTPLAGFEQNSYVANSNFSRTKFAALLEEFLLLRRANVLLFKNLSDEAWSKIGTASGAEISVRAIAFIMVGHVRHHTNILQTRYNLGQ